MIEREFEDILYKYPELIEEGLIFEGRQVNVDRKFIDLLFKDKFGQNLIVELKIGIAKREHIAQLMDYAGYHINIAEGNPPVRVMLIANRIPENFKHSFDYFGFEYKEITIDIIRLFLHNKNDQELLRIFATKDGNETVCVTGISISEELARAETDSISTYPTESKKNETRQAMATRIKSGKTFNQAKCAIELLMASQEPIDMKKIVSFMSTKGYHSKTYYDVFNALVDSDLVNQVTINGKKGYQLKRDD